MCSCFISYPYNRISDAPVTQHPQTQVKVSHLYQASLFDSQRTHMQLYKISCKTPPCICKPASAPTPLFITGAFPLQTMLGISVHCKVHVSCLSRTCESQFRASCFACRAAQRWGIWLTWLDRQVVQAYGWVACGHTHTPTVPTLAKQHGDVSKTCVWKPGTYSQSLRSGRICRWDTHTHHRRISNIYAHTHLFATVPRVATSLQVIRLLQSFTAGGLHTNFFCGARQTSLRHLHKVRSRSLRKFASHAE